MDFNHLLNHPTLSEKHFAVALLTDQLSSIGLTEGNCGQILPNEGLK